MRRDEERAAALEAGDRAKVMQADSEARIALLRKRAKKGKSKEEDQAEKALEKQLMNKGKSSGNGEDMQESSNVVASKRNEAEVSITTEKGHCKYLL